MLIRPQAMYRGAAVASRPMYSVPDMNNTPPMMYAYGRLSYKGPGNHMAILASIDFDQSAASQIRVGHSVQAFTARARPDRCRREFVTWVTKFAQFCAG